MTADLRLGRWQEALADVGEVDCVITDPPYSDRVHSGQRTGSSTRKTTLSYEGIDEAYCHEFAASWAPRTRFWAVIFSDHLAARWHESAWTAAGWYVFAPVIWLRTAPTPRLAGDGPTLACDYLTVARPKRRLETARIGSRPGYYAHTGNNGRENAHPGSKSVGPMSALVRDYSLPGDLVCDPHSGSGSTGVAALQEGRRFVGAEMDVATHARAVARLQRGYTPPLFQSGPAATQLKLGGE